MFQDWNFKDNNPVFEFGGKKFSVQIFTEINRYDLDPTKTTEKKSNDNTEIKCCGLEWAGGQAKAEGSVSIRVQKKNGRLYFDINAAHREDRYIRNVKLVLYNEPFGAALGLRKYEPIPGDDPVVLKYPNGWDNLFTPLCGIKHAENKCSFYRSLDTEVRPKTFWMLKQENALKVELIFEQHSSDFAASITVPTWETGEVCDFNEIMAEQMKYVEKAYSLKSWQERPDVPDWARKISFVASIHAMHWSGYYFNDYKAIMDKMNWLAKYIDPSTALIYIPGWEGRYYFKYPDYSPDERLGGHEGFLKLIRHAHKLGFKVMPMFMINGANPDTPGFHEWGEPSRYVGANFWKNGVGSCDWNTSRNNNLGGCVAVNPGRIQWQNYLVNKINSLLDTYGFDGVFLDLAGIYHNDPFAHPIYGAEQMALRIKEKHPEVIIAGEGWFDYMSRFMPLSQCAGDVRDGSMIWHDSPLPEFFDKYNRYFGHLCMGDVATGRNGVFEKGFNKANTRMPLRKAILPTITVLDDTFEAAPEKSLQIIGDGVEYKKKFT